ncbi:MAG TPA: sulfotransferase family protein [Devosia sp.]|nr:sulfotransferase family protein [Devosia sp.]
MQQKLEPISVGDAMALMRERKYKAAVEMCDRVLELMPENATAICVREHCRWQDNVDPEECIANTRRALDIAPDSPLVRYYLSLILVSNGRIEEAQKLLLEAMELSPEHPRYFFELAENMRFTEENEAVTGMVRAYEENDWTKEQKTAAGFALAKIFDDLGQAERAMNYCMAANALEGRKFDVAEQERQMADLRELAKRGMGNIPDSGLSTEVPIFIVGMPRSGTTLVETILSRHPQVFAAGELPVIPEVQAAIGNWLSKALKFEGGRYTGLEKVPGHVFRQNGEAVLKIVQNRANKEYRKFTDKLPSNALNIALISRLFPNARIVYVRRHPLDCGISNFFKRFVSIDFSYRLDWIGAYYRNLVDTVSICRRMIGNPVLDLSYEQLVMNPEPHVRRLVDFVGLEWNDACLSPEQSDRATVMTASRWQVRQPIYTGSTNRWKRYEPWIGPMIEAMGGMEWIEARVEEAQAWKPEETSGK